MVEDLTRQPCLASVPLRLTAYGVGDREWRRHRALGGVFTCEADILAIKAELRGAGMQFADLKVGGLPVFGARWDRMFATGAERLPLTVPSVVRLGLAVGLDIRQTMTLAIRCAWEAKVVKLMVPAFDRGHCDALRAVAHDADARLVRGAIRRETQVALTYLPLRLDDDVVAASFFPWGWRDLAEWTVDAHWLAERFADAYDAVAARRTGYSGGPFRVLEGAGFSSDDELVHLITSIINAGTSMRRRPFLKSIFDAASCPIGLVPS